jgi:hypothetical protein
MVALINKKGVEILTQSVGSAPRVIIPSSLSGEAPLKPPHYFPLLPYIPIHKEPVNVNSRTFSTFSNKSGDSNENLSVLISWTPFDVMKQFVTPEIGPLIDKSSFLTTITQSSSHQSHLMLTAYEITTMKPPPQPQSLVFGYNPSVLSPQIVTTEEKTTENTSTDNTSPEMYKVSVVPHPTFGLGLRLDEVKTEGDEWRLHCQHLYISCCC